MELWNGKINLKSWKDSAQIVFFSAQLTASQEGISSSKYRLSYAQILVESRIC
jgi:hypothetical protein